MRVSEKYDMQYKYFYKGNFVDQDPDATVVSDYNCGTRTYNGHDAADISPWPFWWRMMDSGYVSIVAAAPGVIFDKQDGGFDRNCGSGVPSNWVIIEHFDGSMTRYHHLKKYSLTSKQEGDTVQAGEFLGLIGSSGNSSHTHLHFAVKDPNGNDIEPFYLNATCNTLNSETWWQNQPVYWDSKISRIMTHSLVPVIADCPDDELVNAKNNFNPGEVFYTGIAFSEGQAGDIATVVIYKPDGSVFTTWNILLTASEIRTYKVDGFILPSGNTGTWKVRVQYRGSFYFHHFTVGCPANLAPSGTYSGPTAYIAGSTVSSSVLHTIAAGDKILYQAQNSIEFKPGFHAPAGVLLRTRLAGCNFTE